MKRRTFLALSAGAICDLAMANLSGTDNCDLIIHNGKIVTVDKNFTIQQAMAVRDGTIIAVGSNEEILKLKGSGTEVIDLKGRMVLPGFIDSHAHPRMASIIEFDHQIPDIESIPDVINYIKARCRVIPKGNWVVVQRAYVTRLRERRYPTKQELDEAAPENPVMFVTARDGVLNTLALTQSGIDRNFQVTDGSSITIEKDPVTGEPTGLIRGGIQRCVKPVTGEKQPTTQDHYNMLLALFKDYNSVGITGTCDSNANESNLKLYKTMLDSGDLPVRLMTQKGVSTIGPIEDITANIRAVKDDDLRKGGPMLRIIGVKTFMDGAMLGGTALMKEPWGVSKMYAITDPDYRGLRQISPQRLVPMVRAAVESGLQFNCHTVGDGAVEAMLDAYEEVNKTLPVRDTRSTVIHANFITDADIRRTADMGIVPMIQPAWMYLDTAALESHFGPERMRRFQPLKTIFDAGIISAGGSDHMYKIGSLRSANPYDPFLAMWTVITRRPKGYDGQFYPDQCLTREQAIRFYTINSAYSMFQEQYVGSLEKGKLADFIVLDTDLLTCPVDNIRTTKVLRTYLNGKVMFERETL